MRLFSLGHMLWGKIVSFYQVLGLILAKVLNVLRKKKMVLSDTFGLYWLTLSLPKGFVEKEGNWAYHKTKFFPENQFREVHHATSEENSQTTFPALQLDPRATPCQRLHRQWSVRIFETSEQIPVLKTARLSLTWMFLTCCSSEARDTAGAMQALWPCWGLNVQDLLPGCHR